jgi:hypothetical protein
MPLEANAAGRNSFRDKTVDRPVERCLQTPAERLFRCAIIETWNDLSEPGVALSR